MDNDIMDVKVVNPDNAQLSEKDSILPKEENSSKVMDDQSEENDCVLRIRGLPWNAAKDEIIAFFSGSKIKDGPNGIHMTLSKEGRPSGNAYVEFESEEDVINGLEKNNEHIGKRYIEVFRCKQEEMKRELKWHGMMNEDGASDVCVRLRGLPFGCSKEEIVQFFTGMEIVRNGITLPTDFQGRSKGDAYVQFATPEIAEKAITEKHKEKIGHRYIEIFKSSIQEIQSAQSDFGPVRMRNMGPSRASPYDRSDRPRPGSQRGMPRGRSFGERGPMGEFGGDRFPRRRENFSNGHSVHMRGLPYRASERDIYEFFQPVVPESVRILYESGGRSAGEADVDFISHEDAVKAMGKHKEKIQHRYIELFLRSEPRQFRREGGGGFNNMDSFDPSSRMERPFDRMSDRGFSFSAERSFGSPSVDRSNRMERRFSPNESERPFGPSAERGFSMGERSFSSTERFPGPSEGQRSFNASAERSFGGSATNRSFGSTPGDRSFGGPAADRSFGGASADRSFGGISGERAYGGAGAERSYGDTSVERSYGGAAPERSYGGAGAERSYGASADRTYGERARGPSVPDIGFRNGMSNNNGQFNRSEGQYARGSDMARNEGPEFYNPGKMFSGESTAYPQARGMNSMIGGNNFSSF